MTLTLESFDNTGSKLEPSKFKEAVPAGLKIGRKAAAQIAATRSLLVNHSEEEFRQTREMLLDPSTRGDFAVEQTAIRERVFNDAVSQLPQFASDPTIPLEERVELVQSASQGFSNPFSYTPNLDLLAEESLISNSGEDESERSALMRYDFAGDIRSVNERKRRVAAAINSLRLMEGDGIADTALDLAEVIAPLAEWIHVDRLLKDVEENLGDGEAEFGQLLGTQKQALYDAIKSMPSSEREDFSLAIIEMMKSHEDIIFGDGNDLMTAQTLERMLLDGNYSNFEKWFDNATSVLDFLMVGGLVRGAGKSVARATSATEEASTAAGRGSTGPQGAAGRSTPSTGTDVVLRDVQTTDEADDIFDLNPGEWTDITDMQRIGRSEATRTDVPPTAPSQVVKDTNPELARGMHDGAMADETGEAAEALYGSNRTEAAAKDLLPEPQIKDGELPNKTEMSGPRFDEPPAIKERRLKEGNTAISRSEMKRVTESLVENLRLQASNIAIKAVDDGTFTVTARYNPLDAGFKSYDEAVDNAEFAFRNYGLDRNNFNILVRDGDRWKEISPEAAKELPEGKSYSVGIKFDYRFRPEDLEEVDLLTTGNFLSKTLDRMPTQFLAKSGQGSVVQNVLDAASTIHPQIVNAASVAVDKTFALKQLYVDLSNDFTKAYKGFSRERRAAITDYINDANFNGLKFDEQNLYARGFSTSEIEALKEWRKLNDALYHATNADLVKTLRGRGYVSVVHRGSDTKLYGRPISKTSVNYNSLMADFGRGADSSISTLSKQEIDELYDSGGEIVRLDEPMEIDGNWVDLVVARNTSSDSFTRAISDNEKVLAYRDGYYPVMYDANYFISKVVKTADGREVRKVVGSTRSRQESEEAISRLQSIDSEAVFEFRKDKRFGQQKFEEVGEEGWSLATNSGLSSQRVRGQRLADMSSEIQRASNTNLKDPLEAIARQIQQVSTRVPMRHYLDTVKKRWMLNYGKHLDLPVNPKTGQTEFPKSVGAISGNNKVKESFVADARTNYNYIYSLENGYINMIDEGYRAALHLAANFAAELKLPTIERAFLSATEVSPINTAKTAAFKMFLSLNPIRQGIVQRGQIIMNGAINPSYMPEMLAEMGRINMARAGATPSPNTAKLLEELESSGILTAVDAHNFIREDMLRLADISATQRVGGALNAPVNFSQKYGFDLAEQDNLIAAWLTQRDLAVKAGKNLNEQRVQEEILGATRAFTLNMNRAGEQPYGRNTLSLGAQFLSFQHKALLQGLTNKSLSRLDRAKLLAYSTAVFGVEASVAKVAYDWALGDMPPSETRDAIEDGLLHTMLNTSLTLASGESQAIDWGDLAPVEAYGMGNAVVGMYSTPLADFVAKSPAGSLLFGGNPRLTNLWNTGMRWFGVHDDYEDPELETKFTDVVNSFASLASGYSNFFKARYALETGQKMAGSGSISDEDVTSVEAALAAAGFRTETEESNRLVRETLYENESFTADDVRIWYTQVKSQLARRNVSVREQDFARRIASEAWRVFDSDRPKATQEITRMLQRDAKDGDYKMFESLLREMGYISVEDTWELINKLPDNVYRQRLTQLMQARNEE